MFNAERHLEISLLHRIIQNHFIILPQKIIHLKRSLQDLFSKIERLLDRQIARIIRLDKIPPDILFLAIPLTRIKEGISKTPSFPI